MKFYLCKKHIHGYSDKQWLTPDNQIAWKMQFIVILMLLYYISILELPDAIINQNKLH